MKRDEFVKRVVEIRKLGTAPRPRVQSKLPSRLTGEAGGKRAQQPRLSNPGDLAESLQGEGGREDFASAEFYRRVAKKEDVEKARLSPTPAAALVLQEAVTTGEMDDVRGQLKPEDEELFGRQGE